MSTWSLSAEDPYPKATYQVRQFGVGKPRISAALATVPPAMAAAEASSLTPTQDNPQ